MPSVSMTRADSTSTGAVTSGRTRPHEPDPADAAGEILLVYDWECPACDTYCRLVRVQQSIGTLRLVNAPKPSAVIEEITQAGLNIDQGMVVKMGGQLYYGADTIHTLALLSSRFGPLQQA